MKTYLEYIKESVNDTELIFSGIIKLLNRTSNKSMTYSVDRESGNVKFEFWKKTGTNKYGSLKTLISEIHLHWSNLEMIDKFHKTDTPFHNTYEIYTKINSENRQTVIDLIVKYFIQQNEIEPPLYLGSEFESFRIKFINDIYKAIDNSYEGQKHWIEKGELNRLKDIKLDPRILEEYPEMKDIKKQTEWS